MDDTERLVAFDDAADDDAEAEDVGELLEADGLALHLAPDRIGALAPAGDLGRDAAVGKLSGELLLDLGDPAVLLRSASVSSRSVITLIGVGIELAERQILELLAHLLHAHAAGERRVDVERFLSRAAPRLGRPICESAHIVQPVGELDQQHPHIVGDGEQELAQILRLLRLLGDEVELFQLGQPLDQMADLAAEKPVDLGTGRVGILDRVVQERRGDGRVVELKVGEDGGDLERVREIGIAGRALLLAMSPHGIDIGAVEQVFVGAGIVLLDPVDQLVLPHHPRLAGLRRSLDLLRHHHRRARHRDPGPGLVLHPRQIDRRARHQQPRLRRKTRQKCLRRHKDIMAQAPRHKPRTFAKTGYTIAAGRQTFR